MALDFFLQAAGDRGQELLICVLADDERVRLSRTPGLQRSQFDVHRVDLKTGKVELDTENPGDVQGWQADNALRIRAAQAQTEDGGTIVRVRDDVKAPWRDLIKWGPDETFGGVNGFSPDDKSLWITTSLEVNAARLIEIDVATGKRDIGNDPLALAELGTLAADCLARAVARGVYQAETLGAARGWRDVFGR